MSLDAFWANVDASLDTIEHRSPDTAQGVIDILNDYASPSVGEAFFPGSGGDRSLLESLLEVGWTITQIEADYHYTVTHQDTGDTLTYTEGDVSRGANII